MGDRVSIEESDGVTTLHLDDHKANVLSLDMQEEIGQGLNVAEKSGNVAVIAGRPGVFSGGFDLATLREGGLASKRMLEGGFALTMRILEFPAPVVIACTGHAIAMGSFLILAADYRVGADGPFRINANEVAIGMTLPWTAIELCRFRLAPAHFDRALNLAEVYSPAGAVEAGWLDEIVAPEDVVARALEKARGFAALDRSAHTYTKLRTRRDAITAVALAFGKDSEEFRVIAQR